MSSSTGEKARAVFLAAVMVLSIVAMSTAFAGSAAAATTTVSPGDSIQSAIDNADPGDTIELEAGTYNQQTTVNKSLTLVGAGNSASGTVLQTSSSGSGNGITVNASDVTVRDLRITDYGNGIRLKNTHSNIVFENVDSVGNNRGMEVRNSADLDDLELTNVNFSNNVDGIRGATTSSIDGLTITESKFNYNTKGIEIYQDESSPVQLNDVTISDTEFIDNAQKGIYTEKLSNATLDNITVDGIISDTYVVNNGIDINLKYDSYENITIRDSTVANVSEGDPLNGNPSASVAVTIKARGSSPDDTSYTSTPASLDDVTIENVVIGDSFNGLRIGEFGKDYSGGGGPTDVTITSSTFRNTSGYYLEDLPDSVDLATVQSNNDFVGSTIESDIGIYTSIQAAVDTADSGDTVSVGPGTYNESVSISTANVTLESTGGAGETTINATGSGDAVSISSQGVTVSGFTLVTDSTGVDVDADAGAGTGIVVSQNNIVDVSEGVNATDQSGTVDATSNWWGATDGPSGDFNGHGAAVTGSVSVDPATVDSGEVTLTTEFAGVVEDSASSFTVAASEGAGFNIEELDEPASGTLVVDIAGQEYVFEDALDSGEVVETDSSENAPVDIAATTETGTANVSVAGNGSTTAIEQAGTVNLVHGARNVPQTGYFLTSMPQSGDLVYQGIDDVSQWDGVDDEYQSFDDSNEVDSIHRGIYMNATSADARYGFTYDTDSSELRNQVGDKELDEGWHVLSSNYNVSDTASTGLQTDLNTQANPDSSNLVVYDDQVTSTLGDTHGVSPYEAYYVYVHVEDDRPVVLPVYNATARSGQS